MRNLFLILFTLVSVSMFGQTPHSLDIQTDCKTDFTPTLTYVTLWADDGVFLDQFTLDLTGANGTAPDAVITSSMNNTTLLDVTGSKLVEDSNGTNSGSIIGLTVDQSTGATTICRSGNFTCNGLTLRYTQSCEELANSIDYTVTDLNAATNVQDIASFTDGTTTTPIQETVTDFFLNPTSDSLCMINEAGQRLCEEIPTEIDCTTDHLILFRSTTNGTTTSSSDYDIGCDSDFVWDDNNDYFRAGSLITQGGRYNGTGGLNNSTTNTNTGVVANYSFTWGRNNNNINSYNAVFGVNQDNEGFGNVMGGNGNDAIGVTYYSGLFGQSNIFTDANHSGGFGLGNVITIAQKAFTTGSGNTISNGGSSEEYGSVAQGRNLNVLGRTGAAFNEGNLIGVNSINAFAINANNQSLGISTFAQGTASVANGSHSTAFHNGTKSLGFATMTTGTNTTATANATNSNAGGFEMTVDGSNALGFGQYGNNNSSNSFLFASGAAAEMSMITSNSIEHFVGGGYFHQILSTENRNAIIGGGRHVIQGDIGQSVVIGGSNYTVGNPNMDAIVYVPKLTIWDIPIYATDIAADADLTLPQGGLYIVTGQRDVRIKP